MNYQKSKLHLHCTALHCTALVKITFFLLLAFFTNYAQAQTNFDSDDAYKQAIAQALSPLDKAQIPTG